MTARGVGVVTTSSISPSEFYDVFTKLWTTWNGGKPRSPNRIALAVSGGSDSMALTYLCSQLVSQRLIPSLKVKAYIVDHQYRPESTQEAYTVAEWVEKLGVESEVLALRWPSGTPASKVTQFETRARTLRYQAIGKSCVSDNTRALFLGHHQDDNTETALVRLASGHKKHGLLGFDDISSIPECHGLYGVSESGDITTINRMRAAIDRNAIFSHSYTQKHHAGFQFSTEPMYISTGGVHLFRPFRFFTKSRLVSTCSENNVPFVTDRTNYDHTLTIRNTVRKLLDSDELPRALQRPSLMDLIQKSRDETDRIHRLSEQLLKAVRILDLDLRTGTLIAKFPSASELKGLHHQQPSESQIDRALPDLSAAAEHEIRAKVMRELADLVSPFPGRKTPLEQFRLPSCIIFPNSESIPEDSRSSSRSDIFTVSGVLWQRMSARAHPPRRWTKAYNSSRRSKSPRKTTSQIQTNVTSDTTNHASDPNIWILSRQPFHRSRPLPALNFALKIPPCSTPSSKDGTQGTKKERKLEEEKAIEPEDIMPAQTKWTDWQLWDNRYWLRISAKRGPPIPLPDHTDEKQPIYPPTSTIPITVRPLEKTDLATIRKQLSNKTKEKSQLDQEKDIPAKSQRRKSPFVPPTSLPHLNPQGFDEVLAELAPEKAKFTLPVIATGSPDNSDLATANSDEARDDDTAVGISGKGGDPAPQIFALPSFPLALPTTLRVETPSSDEEGGSGTYNIWTLAWEVNYKSIDSAVIQQADFGTTGIKGIRVGAKGIYMYDN